MVINCERSFPYRLNKVKKGNKLSILFIIEAPFLHPAWDYQLRQRRSSAAAVQPSGTAFHFKVKIVEYPLQKNIIPLQQSPYPFAHKSAFILTDHCDFDTEEKLKVFLYGNNNNGWLGRGLKITKGVFTIGPKAGEPHKNASLEEEKYFELIKLLAEEGSEIAPHAFKSKGQLTKEQFQEAAEKLSGWFKPKTWIDHGCYLKYCYSQGAKDNPEYLLVNMLKKYQFNNLWSFHDVNIDANQTLNIFTTNKFGPWKILRQSAKYFVLGKWLISAHYLRSVVHRYYLKNIFIEYLMYAMAGSKSIFINWKKNKKQVFKDISIYIKKLTSFNSYHNKFPVPYKNKDVLKFSSALYTEDKRHISQWKENDLLMFYTFEATHLLDIYQQKALRNLVSEYGTHIGHTYILNDLPYINSIFTKRDQQYYLADKWVCFLEAISDYVKEKIIWNPTMGEYARYVLLLQNIKINYLAENKISITNNNDLIVEGYTIVIPKRLSRELCINAQNVIANHTDSNYHFFIIRLLAKEQKMISFC